MPTSVFQGLAQDLTLQQVLDAVGTPPTYEVDAISTGAATAGTVSGTFVWDGIVYAWGPVNYNDSSSTVASAIQAAVGGSGQTLPASSVVGSGGPLATATVTLTFQGRMVGPVTAQVITPSGLTGGTATFTRTKPGTAGGVAGAIANSGGGPNPGAGFPLLIRGSDNKMYHPATIATGDGTTQLGVYLEGGSAQGTVGSGSPTGGISVAFRNPNSSPANLLMAPNMDATGALGIQGSGADGSPVPAKSLAVGGTDGTNLQTLAVNAAGAVLTQSMAATGGAAPAVLDTIGGLDPTSGVARAASVNAAGALATQDASSVPEAPLSINGVAFTLGQTGAPPVPLTVGTSSTLLLADSTGGSALNGVRGQVEIVNVGNTDICISPSLATVWGTMWLIRPGGSLITTYSGPVSAISNNTSGGVTVASPSNQVSIAEWA